MSDERPWKLQLVCCGRDDGVVTCETRADAELTRSAYISAEGHDRQAILTGPPGAVETDPVALLGEYLGALGKGDWSETVCADMRALLEQVRTARNAATARAEKAEAALAEMRELKSVLVMLLMRSGGTVEFSTAERVQTSMRGEFVSTVDRVTGVMRLKFTPQENATPRTAPERAADEQGVREGGSDE